MNNCKYLYYTKSQKREMSQVQEAYKNAVAWLAISALLNAALLGAWLWERAQ